MSARQSPVERDARELAGAALKGAWRRRRDDTSAHDVFQEAIRSREQSTTWAVQRGDIPAARRWARAAELLSQSLDRMLDRGKRDTAAELAKTGIVPDARVVVVRAGYGQTAAPVGTVLTLGETTSPYIFGTDDDGRRWIVYSGDVEVVPDAINGEPEPIPESRIAARYPVGSEVKVPTGTRDVRFGEVTAVRSGPHGVVVCVAVEDSPIRQWWRVDQLERREVAA